MGESTLEFNPCDRMRNQSEIPEEIWMLFLNPFRLLKWSWLLFRQIISAVYVFALLQKVLLGN